METWKAIMLTALFWKKIWTWVKHHWYWPVIIVLLLMSLLTGSSSRKKLFSLLDKQKENYEKELQIVKETTKERDEKKTKIFEKHLKEIKKIEDDHNFKVKDLEQEKQKELVDTIEKNKDRPEDLAIEIAKILGANFHKKNR
tara:strand:+ start:1964 stop:2389 length:426 start_codon:yes stop_codon:yes gene_type:complete